MNTTLAVSRMRIVAIENPNPFTSIANRYNIWKSYRKTVCELEQLSDHQLKDIGLLRSDIRVKAERMRHIQNSVKQRIYWL